jgi:hypothetical protein
MPERKCTKCGETKPLDQFYLNCYGRNGPCNDCVKAKNRAYYEARKATIAAKHAERRQQGHQVDVGALERRRERPREERYAERRAKVNENKRERHAQNPEVRAKIYVETKLRRALRDQTETLAELVGCSVDMFYDWIEYQLVEGMTMDNYGEVWSYDHVIPRSAFNFLDPEEVKKCNHWSNMRPIMCNENSIKNNKRDPALEESHAMTAYCFQIIQDFWIARGNNAQD